MTSTPEARLAWLVPPFMQDLPLEATGEDDLVDKVCALSRTILENRSDDEQAALAVTLYQIVAQLIDFADAVYAGMAFLDMNGRPSMATVLVSRVAHDSPDEQAACEAVETALRRAYSHDDVQTVQLPRVSAVTRIASAPIHAPTTLSSDTGPEVVPRNIIQAYVPIPNGTDLLVFEMSTTSLEDWDLYSELFAEILRTIDWTTDEEIREYQRLSAMATSTPASSVSEEGSAALHFQSSRIIDVLNMQGRFLADKDRLCATVCEKCWSRGLRSACMSSHSWEMEMSSPAEAYSVIDRARRSVARQNEADKSVSWSTEDALGASYHVRIQPSESGIAVTVSSACSQRSNLKLQSDFG